MPLVVIYNPICGDATAETFLESAVLPLLHQNGKEIDLVAGTTSAGHAGTIIGDFAQSCSEIITVVLCSGDGTLNEILNALPKDRRSSVQIHFVLVPCGTANALYSSLYPSQDQMDSTLYRLKSLRSFIDGSSTTPLRLAICSFTSPQQSDVNSPQPVISAVVVSTSLHALLVRDSEALRAEIPGMERFKVAARRNIARWYSGTLKLLPTSQTAVKLYDPRVKDFLPHPQAGNTILELNGPFSYFLSTVNVDRLEPHFRITPLAGNMLPSEEMFDIIIVRPLRDPSIAMESAEAKIAFAEKIGAVMTAAYNDGSHINLRYGTKGEFGAEGDGPTVVEYFRCGRWEWLPNQSDDEAHVVCVDGSIFNIEKGGRAISTVAGASESALFLVHI